MNEAEHNLTLNIIGGEPFEMTRDNGTLFTFFGHLATRNHVFLMMNETDDVMRGMYIFAHHASYAALASFMVDHDYPMRLNGRAVPGCDENAFQQSLDSMGGAFDDELGGGVPDDWLK